MRLLQAAIFAAIVAIYWCSPVNNPAPPVRVAEFVNDILTVNDANLGSLLQDPILKNKPICLISIVGGARTGKSFLLNFFVMYFRARSNNAALQKGLNGTNWMSDADLQRFKYLAGSKPVTTGINIYPEPFLTKDDDGNEVVVVLMDTQGTFSSDTSLNDCAVIFSITSLTSSHMIFNEMRLFSEHHFQHLRLSVEIAKAMGNRTLYEGLTFLVRDAELDDKYGIDGGKQYFQNHVLPNANQSKESSEMRRAIVKSFNRLDAFLLPHPGGLVAKDNAPLKISDIDQNFRYYVAQLIENIPILPKKVDGVSISCGEWIKYFRALGKEFEKNVIQVKPLYETTCRLNKQVAVSQLVRKFESQVGEAAYKPNGNADALINTAVKELAERRTMCGVSEDNQIELRKQLNAIAVMYRQRGESDRAYEQLQKELKDAEIANTKIESEKREIEQQREAEKKAHEERQARLQEEIAAKNSELERAINDAKTTEEEKKKLIEYQEVIRKEQELEKKAYEEATKRSEEDLAKARAEMDSINEEKQKIEEKRASEAQAHREEMDRRETEQNERAAKQDEERKQLQQQMMEMHEQQIAAIQQMQQNNESGGIFGKLVETIGTIVVTAVSNGKK